MFSLLFHGKTTGEDVLPRSSIFSGYFSYIPWGENPVCDTIPSFVIVLNRHIVFLNKSIWSVQPWQVWDFNEKYTATFFLSPSL
jgi:hypothetical protein